MELAADLFQDARILYLPITALLLFFFVLLGAFLWVLRPGAKEFYQKVSLMPFSDEHGERKP